MLACARIGAIHSVVFGGFAAKELATRIDDAKPKVILSASCGIEPGRIVHYKPLLDEAIELASTSPRPASSCSGRRPRRRWSPAAITTGRSCGRRRWCGRSRPRLRAGRRHRSALHPLHLRHDRHPEGRGARQRRPHGRAQMVDEESLRRRAGRGVLGGLRRRLGGRPQLHRLCAAVPRLHHRSSTRASRSARPTPARSGASSPSTAASPCSPRRPRSAPSRRRTRRASCFAQYDLSKFRTLFLAGERADPDTVDWAEKLLQGAGDRSLVADRDRLGDRRQSGRARPAAGQARLADGADAGLRRARRRRAVQGGGGQPDGLDRRQAAAAARRACRRCGTQDERFRESYLAEFPGYYKTADAGFKDEDGYLYIMSRTDDIINVAGHRLSTGGMEEVLAAHQDVAECAVIGIADELKGEVPCGFIVLKSRRQPAADRDREGVRRAGAREDRPGRGLQARHRGGAAAEDALGQDPARHHEEDRRRRDLDACRRRSTIRRSSTRSAAR